MEMDEEKFTSGELMPETEQEDEEESEIKTLVVEVNSIEQVPESIVDQTIGNTRDNQVAESEKEEEEDISIQSYSSFSESSNGECRETENVLFEEAVTLGVEGVKEEEEEEEEEEERFKSTIKKVIEETLLLEDINGEDVKQTHQEEEEDDAKSDAVISEPEKNKMKKEYGYGVQLGIQRNRGNNKIESIMSDCLLLMMCEPKQSMEVSKKTLVCSSTGFILPERKQAKAVKKKKKKEIPEETKIGRNIDKSQHLLL
ncbi:hypothetical protein HAX54_035402 [Datura stramonium]|uniref:Uncharacterized protein n=1 Tax=Datura stramonium TaxID=4076 RepID=A0ABS8VGC9_DATST|nr:hypothetical protein [Datura stramonium]